MTTTITIETRRADNGTTQLRTKADVLHKLLGKPDTRGRTVLYSRWCPTWRQAVRAMKKLLRDGGWA